MEFLDLIQGRDNGGLERGVEKADPTRGYRVLDLRMWWIRQTITRAINSSKPRAIRLPIHITGKIKKVQRELAQPWFGPAFPAK